jgi:hypothetical protein
MEHFAPLAAVSLKLLKEPSENLAQKCVMQTTKEAWQKNPPPAGCGLTSRITSAGIKNLLHEMLTVPMLRFCWNQLAFKNSPAPPLLPVKFLLELLALKKLPARTCLRICSPDGTILILTVVLSGTVLFDKF